MRFGHVPRLLEQPSPATVEHGLDFIVDSRRRYHHFYRVRRDRNPCSRRPEVEFDPPSGIVEEIWQEIIGDDDADDQP